MSTLPAELLRDKLVIDATNHWEPIDGPLPEHTQDARSTSEIVHAYLPDTRFVKDFNHLGYHDLDERGRPSGHPDRIAVALVAGTQAGLQAKQCAQND